MKIRAVSNARLLYQTAEYCNFTHEHTIEVSDFEVEHPSELKDKIGKLQELVANAVEEGYQKQHNRFRQMSDKYFEV